MLDYGKILSQHRPELSRYVELYKHLHGHPELSYQEKETSQLIAKELGEIADDAFHVKENIGGFGVVASLSNGNGPVVMLRADMDALPVEEMTGLAYASKVLTSDHEGNRQPVMHACGHDMHMTSLLACAKTMYNAKNYWSGTLLLVFQPAEEKGTGAQAMVDDGLYDPNRHNVPIPDVVLSPHVTSARTGFIGSRAGLMAGAARNYKVTLQGRSAHASQPDKSIDTVVMAAFATTRLQTLVSREMNPQELSAVTVSSIKAGNVENIIPQEAEMKIDMRSTSNDRMTRLDQGMRRIINAEATASASPDEPVFERTRDFPVTWNSPKESDILFNAFKEYFGESFSSCIEPIGMSEDFSILATSVNRPSVMWIYGGTDAAYYDEMIQRGKRDEIPSNHSAYFAPTISPTLQVAIDSYVISALSFLSR